MATGKVTRLAIVCLLINIISAQNKKVPDVTIEAFQSKGIRVSIPDLPKLGLFVFQGNVNRAIGKDDIGTISGEVIQASNGRWVYEDPNVELKVGDVIKYHVFVSLDGVGFLYDDLQFIVTELLQKTSLPANPTLIPEPPRQCLPTVTKVRGGTACAGQIIFEDNFDSLRTDVWQLEQYKPLDHPEYPFVSYQRGALSVENGNLKITAKLQQTMPGFTNDSIWMDGYLNLLDGCTGRVQECTTEASGASILPPVVTGRITSRGLPFTYGTVVVRAKFPQGDWLYPEILLEPFLPKYGSVNYASGVVKIAAARGNVQLRSGSENYGNNVLYGGLIMNYKCRDKLLSQKKANNQLWGNDYHEYSAVWTPEGVTLKVDGQEWARIEPSTGDLQSQFGNECDLPRRQLSAASNMAPFDDYFYITLGLAAGGITEFKDGSISSGFMSKPWRNGARKSSFNFWENMDSWYPTWSQPELLIDYVKVTAL